jgi:hypothetical protein
MLCEACFNIDKIQFVARSKNKECFGDLFTKLYWVGRWGGVAYMTNKCLAICIGDPCFGVIQGG